MRKLGKVNFVHKFETVVLNPVPGPPQHCTFRIFSFVRHTHFRAVSQNVFLCDLASLRSHSLSSFEDQFQDA